MSVTPWTRGNDPVCPFNGTFCDVRCRAHIQDGDGGRCARMEALEDVRRSALAQIRACSMSDGRRDGGEEKPPA